jgi:hypothetical protein
MVMSLAAANERLSVPWNGRACCGVVCRVTLDPRRVWCSTDTPPEGERRDSTFDGKSVGIGKMPWRD